MKKENKDFDISDVLGGSLNILGLKIDLGKLLSSPEEVRDRLQQLREKLKQAGGKEVLGDEEWRNGSISVGGYFRTRGILGDAEYHIGTTSRPSSQKGTERESEAPEVVEPAADVFDEADEIMIIAEVPGVNMEDLELKIEDKVISLSSKPTARRSYRKEIPLDSQPVPESLEANCRNGILEIHLKKRKPQKR